VRSLRIAPTALAVLGLASGASAQEYSGGGRPPTATVAADSVMSADTLAAADGRESSATFDFAGVWRLASRVELAARSVIYRGRDGEWDADVYQLVVRYDRPGAIRLRWEAGYLPSPIGILPLESRADQNPVILPATSYTASLPSFEEGTPSVQLSSPLYPLALQVTASAARWDARAALLGSSPVRVRPLTGANKPPASPQIALGGGVTPHIGLRLGASFARGPYAKASEVTDPSRGDRIATVVGLDADYSVGYTRAYVDWVRNAYQRASDSAVATSLTATAVRTLSPRWFAAARLQRQTTSNLLEAEAYPGDFGGYETSNDGGGSNGYAYHASLPRYAAEWVDAGPAAALSLESIVGYRLTPDMTFRFGYLGYRVFGDSEIEHHATASVVWVRRWR
jgi:hypothetical protein